MQTLSYGYKLPVTGDRGNIFFPGLEDNITRVNGHTHNGTDSAAIPTQNLSKTTQSILAVSWAATSGGTYRQEVTMPAGFTFAGTQVQFRLAGASDDLIFPTVEEGSASNKYWVYTNDNTLAYTAIYV